MDKEPFITKKMNQSFEANSLSNNRPPFSSLGYKMNKNNSKKDKITRFFTTEQDTRFIRGLKVQITIGVIAALAILLRNSTDFSPEGYKTSYNIWNSPTTKLIEQVYAKIMGDTLMQPYNENTTGSK